MDKLLSKDELAEILGVSTDTISDWICRQHIPFVKLGPYKRSLVRFSLPAVEAWLTEHTVVPADKVQRPAAEPRRQRREPGPASAETVEQFKAFIKRST